jgi:hypothetical protein
MMVGWFAYAGFLRPRAAGKVQYPFLPLAHGPPK